MKYVLSVFLFSFISFISVQAQTETLDQAFADKLLSLSQKTVADSQSFVQTPYPDFAVKFQEKFDQKWSEHEKIVMQKLADAKTTDEVNRIRDAAKTEHKNMVNTVFWDLSKEADAIYNQDLTNLTKSKLEQKVQVKIKKDLLAACNLQKAVILKGKNERQKSMVAQK